MKKSGYIELLLIGTAVTVFSISKSNEKEVVRQEYYAKEDCVRDWGDAEEYCQETITHSGGRLYYGPRYYWDRDLGKPVEVKPDGNTRVLSDVSNVTDTGSSHGKSEHLGSYSRGGFGSTARGFTAGG